MGKNLSPQILALIFKNMSKHDLRHNVSLVCSLWYKIVYGVRFIRSNVELPCLFDKLSERVMKDLKTYPTFGPKVKTLTIKESEDADAKDFYRLVESCPNMEILKVSVSKRSNFLTNVAPQLFSPENPFHSNLKMLNLDFTELGKLRDDTKERYTEVVDLHKLMNHTMSGLQKLIIKSSIEKQQRKRFALVINSPNRSVNNTLQVIYIVSPYSVMTKNCLSYIISGKITKLENLNLLLSFVDKKDEDVGDVEERKKDVIWDKLKQFCLTSVKNYNICFRTSRGNHLFSINNCKRKSDVHEEENELDFLFCDEESDSEAYSDGLDLGYDSEEMEAYYEHKMRFFGGCAYD